MLVASWNSNSVILRDLFHDIRDGMNGINIFKDGQRITYNYIGIRRVSYHHACMSLIGAYRRTDESCQ